MATSFILICALMSLTSVDAYSSGADPGACTSMIPSHGPGPQSSTSPFTVVVATSATYSGGSTVSVSLQGSGTQFKGFLIQARVVGSDTSYGSFTPVSGTKATCTGNTALTHDGSVSPFNKLDLVWTAPATPVGHIKFHVTFVQSKLVFWVQELSGMITDPTAPAANTGAPVTLSPSVMISQFVTTSCGNAKGCYRDPVNCEEPNCDVLVTWTDAGNNVNFELMAKTDGWVSLGLSADQNMGDDSVTDCMYIIGSSAVVVRNSFNTGRSNSPLGSADLSSGISNAKGGYKDGALRCTYSRTKTNSNSKIYDLSTSYYLLVAKGAMSGTFKLKHTTSPKLSPQTASFAQNANIGGTSVNLLIKAHGCIMILAWILCASVGIIIARYMKPMWNRSALCGEKVWFAVHRGLMISVLVLCCISFVIIFVKVGGYSQLGPNSFAHPILGIIVTCLCVINPIMAIFRPHPEDKYRPIFNWFHWGVGTCAHILAVPTIFLGMNIPSAVVYWWLTWVLVAWVIIHVAIELTLEIHQCCMHKKNKDKKEEFEMRAKNDPSLRDSGPTYSGKGFKSFMLGLHITLTVILSLVLVIGVAISS